MSYHPMGNAPALRTRRSHAHVSAPTRRSSRIPAFLALGVFGLVAFLAASATPAFAAGDNLIAQIKERGALRVCEAAYPPYNVKNPKSGQWEGMDVDIAADMAKELGVKLEHVDSTFATLIPSINTGKCDLSIAATYVTPPRAEQVLYSTTFSADTKTIFVPQSSKAKTYADIDKPGVVIASRAGTSEEAYARRFFKHAQVKAITSSATEAHLLAVAAGRADAAFAGTVGGLLFLKENPNVKLRVLGDKPLDPTPFAFMLPPGEYHFQQYVDVFLGFLKRKGTMQEIRDKWLAAPE
jgi:ABC-type amino acid transport substrate-binding protein